MRIDGIFPGQNINLTGITDILSRVNVGDVIRAQILDITANELMLKLFDGTTFTASTISSVDAKKGDFVDFTIKNKNDKQILLETVKPNEIKQPDADGEIKKQLAALDIKPDTRNMEIAKEIKSNNLPINKEIFDKALDLLVKFKDLNPTKAVFFTANDMKPVEKNISTLNQIVEGKLKVGSKLEELLKSLTEVKDAEILGDIEQKISPKVPAKDPVQDVRIGETGTIKEDKSPIQKSQTDDAKSPIQKSQTDDAKSPIQKSQTDDAKSILKLVRDEINNQENSGAKDIIKTLPDKVASLLKVPNADNQSPVDKTVEFLGEQVKQLESLPVGEQKEALKVFDDLITKIKINELPSSDIKPEQHSVEKVKSEIHKAFESFFVKINSENLKDDINVKNLYKDIYHKLELIKDSVDASTLPNKDDILNKVENLQDSLKFLNEINNNSTYVQVPLNTLDKNTTAELYVLKRDSRRKKIDPENVTMFISLNTQNIGQIDSLIGINKKNISLNMRVEKQEIIGFIKENYKDLYNRLSNKGYKLVDVKYKLMEEPVNLLNVNKVAKKEIEANRQSIDLRL